MENKTRSHQWPFVVKRRDEVDRCADTLRFGAAVVEKTRQQLFGSADRGVYTGQLRKGAGVLQDGRNVQPLRGNDQRDPEAVRIEREGRAAAREKEKPRMWITREQWKKLYAQLPPHMKPMAEFAIETGLRQSNVLNLKWSQVDLKRKFVWLEAQEMKSDEALPVPLSRRACVVLENRDRARREAAREVRGNEAHSPDQSDVYVFTYRGRPIKEVKTAFIAACVRAGLGRFGADGRYTGFTWHGLRHTWATWHVQAETPLDVLQKLGGWSDERMVKNIRTTLPAISPDTPITQDEQDVADRVASKLTGKFYVGQRVRFDASKNTAFEYNDGKIVTVRGFDVDKRTGVLRLVVEPALECRDMIYDTWYHAWFKPA